MFEKLIHAIQRPALEVPRDVIGQAGDVGCLAEGVQEDLPPRAGLIPTRDQDQARLSSRHKPIAGEPFDAKPGLAELRAVAEHDSRPLGRCPDDPE